MNETKLLRCPFCGGEAFLHTVEPHKHIIVDLPEYGGGAFVECTNCSCAISGETAEEAAKAWNTRKPLQNIVERLEAISDEANDKIIVLEDSMYYDGYEDGVDKAIEIVKEEGGLNCSSRM